MADLRNVDRVFDSSGNALFSGGGGNLSSLIHVREEQTSGTIAGGSSAGWQTRILNTVVTNQIPGSSLASNQITLPPGDYYVNGGCPSLRSNQQRVRLRDITGSVDLVLGMSRFSGTSDTVSSRPSVDGRFSLSIESNVELQLYADQAKTVDGLGPAVSSGEIEIYAEVLIWKLDSSLEILNVIPTLLFHVQDQKAANTAGGTFTSGAFQTRDLNTIVSNQITDASLSANQITLPIGEYYIEAHAPTNDVDRHKARLRDITNSNDLLIGSSIFSSQSADNTTTLSFVTGRFSLTASTILELQHRCQTSKSDNGFGVESNFGVIEVYSDVKIWKVDGVLGSAVTLRGLWEELDRQTASASTQIDFTFDPTLFDEFEIIVDNVAPVTDGQILQLLVSTDEGSTFKTGATDYDTNIIVGQTDADTVTDVGTEGATSMDLTGALDNATDRKGFGKVNSGNLTVTGDRVFISLFGMTNTAGNWRTITGTHKYKGDAASNVDGLRFKFGTGNIASGTFILRGRRKAGIVVSSAVGKQTIWIPAAAMTPTVSNGCALLAAVESTAGQPDQHVLGFDPIVDEHAQFDIAFPKSWDKSVVTFKVFWTHQGGQAGGLDGVAWALQGVALSSGDPFATAYGTAVVVTDDQVTADDIYVTAESTAVTIEGTPLDDDLTFFRILRDISDGADDLDIDAQLVGIQVFYLNNRLTDD